MIQVNERNPTEFSARVWNSAALSYVHYIEIPSNSLPSVATSLEWVAVYSQSSIFLSGTTKTRCRPLICRPSKTKVEWPTIEVHHHYHCLEVLLAGLLSHRFHGFPEFTNGDFSIAVFVEYLKSLFNF